MNFVAVITFALMAAVLRSCQAATDGNGALTNDGPGAASKFNKPRLATSWRVALLPQSQTAVVNPERVGYSQKGAIGLPPQSQ